MSNASTPAAEIISLAGMTDEQLFDRLSIVNAERAAIREMLRQRRANERETAQRSQRNGGAR